MTFKYLIIDFYLIMLMVTIVLWCFFFFFEDVNKLGVVFIIKKNKVEF
jgi:hypothetical protein